MCIRDRADVVGSTTQLIAAVGKLPTDTFIVATDQGPEFRADVDLYLDAPYLEAPLGGQHNQHSYPLTMELTGPLTFLPNGRMVINQVNGNVIPISVELTQLLGFLGASIDLQIPAGAVKLQYVGVPLKR